MKINLKGRLSSKFGSDERFSLQGLFDTIATAVNKIFVAFTVDGVNATGSGSFLLTGSGGLGYGTGSGGTVTQATNKSTTVTLDKTNGKITMNAASLAGGASVAFALSNSTIAASDVLICERSNVSSAGDNAYDVKVDRIASTAAVIVLKNNTGGALAEAVTLNFAVIKAVTS